MHNLSMQHIKELAHKIAGIGEKEHAELLELARELYESSVLYVHRNEADKDESGTAVSGEYKAAPTEKPLEDTETANPVHESGVAHRELSIQERIRMIMEKAQAQDNSAATQKTAAIPEKPETQAERPAPAAPAKTESEQNSPAPPETTLEEEFKDAISADLATELFEKAEKIEITKKSLNEKLAQNHIQIGLNDRIAFVKHLFNGSQTDFNRVLSQLNTFETEAQAKHFLETLVKPEYNWNGKEEYETRFINLIERRFL